MNITLKEIPAPLHKKLVAAAVQHGRSLNREILTILEKTVTPSRTNDQQLLERIRSRRQKLSLHLKQSDLDKMIDQDRP